MASTKIADIVASIPYGNEGMKRYRTVGALLKSDSNDEAKGPGFIVVLNTDFNPAGIPGKEGSIFLSCYHPQERPKPQRTDSHTAALRTYAPVESDDDIPF